MSNSLIEIRNISKAYLNKKILSDITYSFENGYIYAILGASGSGKTTLLNILGLLDNKYEGDVIINDTIISKSKDNYEIRNQCIGFIFQSYYLIENLNVEDNIKMPLKYSKEASGDDEYFKKIIEALGISTLLKENVNYLSGGEKQRIAIARAFINKPSIIICDEPTGNLDDQNSASVIEILKSFISKDRLIIIVTHDYFLAKQCDVILELKDGKLYEKK